MTTQPCRPLRTEAEIRAAGRALGESMPPLSEGQVNACAALLAPVLSASVAAKRGAA